MKWNIVKTKQFKINSNNSLISNGQNESRLIHQFLHFFHTYIKANFLKTISLYWKSET